jgi:hypothetical protein
MKALIRLLVGLVIALGALNAQARVYNQGELDALLAPIALYPDPLLNNILDAVRYPDDVMAAGDWSRANPGLQGDAALQAVDSAPWAPSVKSLVAYPDVLARLVESPQWLADLGDAYATHGPYIQTTIQQLRERAQSSGYLQSDANQNVYQQAGQIYIQPVYPTVVYAPYYNPFVVYGSWWWPAYRPWAFRPFYARPIIVTRVVRPVHYTVRPYHAVPASRQMPLIGKPPYLGHPQVQSPAPTRFAQPSRQNTPAVAPRARMSTPPARFAERRAQYAQSAPQMHRAPAPQVHSMPAPQMRASERPSGVGHSGAAQAGGNGGGGWKHRG